MQNPDKKRIRKVLHRCGMTAEKIEYSFEKMTPNDIRRHMHQIARDLEVIVTNDLRPNR